jgi:hypothetical protein
MRYKNIMKESPKQPTSPINILRLALLSGLLTGIGAGLPSASAMETTAVGANDFLNSIGVCVHVQHGVPADKLVQPLKYTGIRVVRDGADQNFDMSGLLLLHRQAGVLIDFGPGSAATDPEIAKTIKACKKLAEAGGLLSIEGPNEPNNFGGVTYHGQNSDKLKSWVPVANFQRDLYQQAKSDLVLSKYPVFGVSEPGAEDDNSGLQYLTIPNSARTTMPGGTKFSDFLNCHNYVCGQYTVPIDNLATLAASTKPAGAFDPLYSNNGLTWRGHFAGYSERELDTMPKVTTETGWRTDNTPAGDDIHGKILSNLYLAQYKAGWKYTFVYELTDDPDGPLGFYKGDLATPRKAADYLHNLTTILADNASLMRPGKVDYTIRDKPATVHDLLIQKSNGTYELAVWGERVKGSNNITVDLGGLPYASVKVYDPTIGTTPAQTLRSVASVPLVISDHALILEFK